MIDLPCPDLILTHESDLDGLLSGLLLQRLAARLFGMQPTLQSSHNDEWRRRPLPSGPVWVADLGFDPRMDQPKWVVIDHHVNRIKPRTAKLIHDPTKSAARLCYEMCQEAGLATPSLDRLVHLNDVSDLFIVDDPDFVVACDHANLVKTYQFWTMYELIQGDPEKLLDHQLLEVIAVKRKVENPLGLAWSKSHVARITNEVGCVDTLIGNGNLILHQLLAEKATPYTVLASLCRGANGAIIVSFRSRNDQALRIAELFNGGGHANAAGAALPRSIHQMSDAIEYMQKILHPVLPENGPKNSVEDLLDVLDAAAP